ncbi:MAG TPA: ABC-2 family transporter protein [Gemmatales bacterium]|nr:ABC-2 family transporter protein [Gemmatales bacterium]HMP59719.1 ABC-2 family transporter protein [Gemmatales bacterium]
MADARRYFRLLGAFARVSMAQELAFRGNFLAKITVEILWLGLLLVFYRTIFAQTSVVATWSQWEYLFFVGCYFMIEGLIETFFLANAMSFSDLVRTGGLDFYLLQPIDEQFLISFKSIDWSTVPNVFLGLGVMTLATLQGGWPVTPGLLAVVAVLCLCGVGLAYGFLLMLTSSSVWLLRNQSLMEMWWLFTSLMRYPREIFSRSWAAPLGFVFTFLVPIMLVVSVPAATMVKLFDPLLCAYAVVATAAVLCLARRVLHFALRSYRSASS